MENCLLNGKEICAYELKDTEGYYNNELVVAWKQFAHEKLLTCVECGAKVRLAAGQIMEPYFAHYDKKECSYGNTVESEESRKAKRLLYTLAKCSFPNSEIKARYKLTNGKYTTLYIKNEGGDDISIEFRRQNLSVEEFHMKSEFYNQQGIRSIFVIAIDLNKDEKQLSWFQELIQKTMGYVVFINVFRETLLFKKSIEYYLNGKRNIKIVSAEYKINEITINHKGEFVSDFMDVYHKIKQEIDDYVEAEERRIAEAKKREELRYERYRAESALQEREITINTLYKKIDDFYMQNKFPAWVRKDILRTAIVYLYDGNIDLISIKYQKLIEEYKLW